MVIYLPCSVHTRNFLSLNPDNLSQPRRLNNFHPRPMLQYLSRYFRKIGNREAEFQRAILKNGRLLVLVPYLIAYPL